MNSLLLLKECLQKILNESTESQDFKEALSDGVYACQFETATGFEMWIKSWEVLDHDATTFDEEYQQGVQFVSDIWQEIKWNVQS